MTFYSDDAEVGRLTKCLLAQQITILQTHRLALDEETHVSLLTEFFDPPPGSIIMDLGCGVGGVATIMKKLRPDLSFIFLNQSQSQLDLCPDWGLKVLGSFEDIPRPFILPDCAMMHFAIGHGDPWNVFRELRRILPPGGVFCLYDLVGTSKLFEEVMGYHLYEEPYILGAAWCSKFRLSVSPVEPKTFINHFKGVYMPGDKFDEIFKGVTPKLFRFVKEL